MIAVLKQGATLRQKAEVVRHLEPLGLRVQVSEVGGRSMVAFVGSGDETARARALVEPLEAVESVLPDAAPYPLASREHAVASSTVAVRGVVFGGPEVVVAAGPCSVECEPQIVETARAVKRAGGKLLRGGAFKPRTSPYAFQGLEEDGLRLLALAREETSLPVVTEVVAPEDVDLVARYADMLQIGARNMQNFRLLTAAGRSGLPVLLKRGMMSTIEELLLAAEYVLSTGNPQVVLCERGIRTFEKATRNTLDIAAVPLLKQRTHLPVIVDPSHACGIRSLVPALSLAAIAAGADGLIVEIHPNPDKAWSDGSQSLTFGGFDALMASVSQVAKAVGRTTVPVG